MTPQDGPETGQGAATSPTPVTLDVGGAESAAADALISLYTGRNGVPNAWCRECGWIDSGETVDGRRRWGDVEAAVAAHLAGHPEGGRESAAERERAAVRDALSCSIHAARKAWLAAPMSAVIDIEYAEWLADAVMRDLPGLMREHPEAFGLRREWLGTERFRLVTDWETLP